MGTGQDGLGAQALSRQRVIYPPRLELQFLRCARGQHGPHRHGLGAYAKKFVDNLEAEIGLANLDLVAANYREDRVAVLYNSMWDGTRKLASRMAAGVAAASPGTDVRVHNLARTDKNDAITDVFRSKAVLVVSPTINKGVLSSVAGLLEMV
jgi:flavorubredoxin